MSSTAYLPYGFYWCTGKLPLLRYPLRWHRGMIRRQVMARPCSLKHRSRHLPWDFFLSKSTWSYPEDLFFSWWPRYQYLRELLVKHWDIKQVSQKLSSIWYLFWYHTGKKWLHKMRYAKNSNLLHSYVPSLTLPLTLQVIPWSLQTKKSRAQLCGEKRKKKRYKTLIKKIQDKKKKGSYKWRWGQAGRDKTLTPKIDEEIVVASRLYSRVEHYRQQTGATHGREKGHRKQNALGRAGQSGNTRTAGEGRFTVQPWEAF